MLVLLPAQHKLLADKVQLAQVQWLLKPLITPTPPSPLRDVELGQLAVLV